LTSYQDYSSKFETIRMRRERGILELRVHTNDGPLRWSLVAHDELEQAFLDVGRDPENQVVILTGTGDEFSGPTVVPGETGKRHLSAEQFDGIRRVGSSLIHSLLNIDVPVIGAINGPAYRHPELPLLSDIVLASDNVVIQDPAHFQGGLVPGDGVHVVFPLLMGLTRGRYFLLTGQILNAVQAKEMGLVNEVLPKAELMNRAWELANVLVQQSALVRRYSRQLLTHELKSRMVAMLGYGLALEGLAQTPLNSG
jgi:enoyl-CoA hydratase/carnithine racemase